MRIEIECKGTTNPHSVVGLCGFAWEYSRIKLFRRGLEEKSDNTRHGVLSFTFLSVDIGLANTDTVSNDAAKVILYFEMYK